MRDHQLKQDLQRVVVEQEEDYVVGVDSWKKKKEIVAVVMKN